MKSRSKQLLDKAIAATVAAIEIYNKPDFQYREETFSILAINGWELLFKAKWLEENHNKIQFLYVKERRQKKDGGKSNKQTIKRTRSGNPFTYSLDYLAKKLIEQKHLEQNAWVNIQALIELRDSSVHFYNSSSNFAQKLQEIGAASLENFVSLVSEWFKRDLSEFNFYLMPLSFVDLPTQAKAIVSNKEEQNFLNYLEHLEVEADSKYFVTVDIGVRLLRSSEKNALGVHTTSNPDAQEVYLTEEDMRKEYPWICEQLTQKCRERYSNFIQNKEYNGIRLSLHENRKFCYIRYLNPTNPKSSKQVFYKPSILDEFDKHYTKKKK